MRGILIPLCIAVSFKLISQSYCPDSCMPAQIYNAAVVSQDTYPLNSMFMLKTLVKRATPP